MNSLFAKIIEKSLTIPITRGAEPGNGAAATRQLDVALLSIGFKLTGAALNYLSGLHPTNVNEISISVLAAVRQLVGDHVQHNVYFKEFPAGVPDTLEFWVQCIADALADARSATIINIQLATGTVNLLDLPKYGRYQHSYEEMVAAHAQFIPNVKDRLTLIHLGKTLSEEALNLYHSLATGAVPLTAADLELLGQLAELCLSDPQPETIPVRENRAVINKVRVWNDRIPLVDTPTDILRLACALSGGDVTLTEKTKFKSLPRRIRHLLLAALDSVIAESPAKLGDVNQYRERWKRLGERLHPHEFRHFKQAQDLFAVARCDNRVSSFNAKVELAFAARDMASVIKLLANAPGLLFRNLDTIIRKAAPDDLNLLLETAIRVIDKASARVILSVYEHLLNRTPDQAGQKRIFANRKGTAFVTPDARRSIDPELVVKLFDLFDAEMLRRLPVSERLVINGDILNVALPLSDKNKASGFSVMPRGTTQSADYEILRFFYYWKQKDEGTDYDLSMLMLDSKFQFKGQVSWTNLRQASGDALIVHSGDVVDGTDGAAEFIDINLRQIDCQYIVPQVNLFNGESFLELAESFFGFMGCQPDQRGKPFEAATVRTKFELRGKGKVALPLIFIRGEDQQWQAKWLHLYLNGEPRSNRVETNRLSTSLLVKAMVERDYLTAEYLIGLLQRKADSVIEYQGQSLTEAVTYIGLAAPEHLPAGSTVVTLNNLATLIPA